MNVANEWKKYRDKMYPRGIHPIQEKECSQAFFAAFAIALDALSKLADLPEDQGVEKLQDLHKQVEAELNRILTRNNHRMN